MGLHKIRQIILNSLYKQETQWAEIKLSEKKYEQ